jgi:hypothetical protein
MDRPANPRSGRKAKGMISNWLLLFAVLGKTLLYTGVGPAILFVYIAGKLVGGNVGAELGYKQTR